MNIDNHFEVAKHELVVAQADVNEHDYDGALVSLTKSYSHIRELINQVLALKRLKSKVTPPAGEDGQ